MKTKFVDSDVLIVGGGMAGCGAAYEARYWGRGLKIVVVEKGQIERSGVPSHVDGVLGAFLHARIALPAVVRFGVVRLPPAEDAVREVHYVAGADVHTFAAAVTFVGVDIGRH